MAFPTMRHEDHAAVFGVVPVLNGLNKKLLRDFDHRVHGEVKVLDFSNGALASEEPAEAGGEEERWAKVRVGDILLAVLPMFKLYTEYGDRYEEARELVSSLSGEENTTEFARSLKEGVATYSAGVDLQSLLIEPIQRIPRYPMLVERLFELTPDEHPDKADLAAAFKLSLYEGLMRFYLYMAPRPNSTVQAWESSAIGVASGMVSYGKGWRACAHPLAPVKGEGKGRGGRRTRGGESMPPAMRMNDLLPGSDPLG